MFRLACAGVAVLGLIFHLSPAEARDGPEKIDIREALNDPDYQKLVGTDVSFHFGNQAPPVGEQLGTVKGDRKARLVLGRTPAIACPRAMTASLALMAKRARIMGGDAVVNIVSLGENPPFSSATQFDCQIGHISVRVTLQGTVIKTKK